MTFADFDGSADFSRHVDHQRDLHDMAIPTPSH